MTSEQEVPVLTAEMAHYLAMNVPAKHEIALALRAIASGAAKVVPRTPAPELPPGERADFEAEWNKSNISPFQPKEVAWHFWQAARRSPEPRTPAPELPPKQPCKCGWIVCRGECIGSRSAPAAPSVTPTPAWGYRKADGRIAPRTLSDRTMAELANAEGEGSGVVPVLIYPAPRPSPQDVPRPPKDKPIA